MNNDLLKSERELARGNADEARAHAWNALGTVSHEELPRLQEVATELGDQLLMHEIDRRGLSAEHSLRSQMSGTGDIDALDERL